MDGRTYPWVSMFVMSLMNKYLARSTSARRSTSVRRFVPLLAKVDDEVVAAPIRVEVVVFSSRSVDANDDESDEECRCLWRRSRSWRRCRRLRERDRDLRLDDFFLWWWRSRLRLRLLAIVWFENKFNKFRFYQFFFSFIFVETIDDPNLVRSM